MSGHSMPAAKAEVTMMITIKYSVKNKFELAAMVLAGSLAIAVSVHAAQPQPRRVDPVQANRDARQATQNLDRDVNAGIRNLQRLTRDADKLESELKSAKRSADRANDAADKAFEAASKCDRVNFERYAKQAREAVEQAEKQKERADETEMKLKKDIADTMNGVNKRVTDIQNTLDQGYKAAKDAGLADNSVTVGNLANAQGMLNNELAKLNSGGTKANDFKDEGSLHKLNKAKSEFDAQLKKIKEENDPGDVRQKVEQRLKDGEAVLERCENTGNKTQDVALLMDNRPEQIACADRALTESEVKDLFGELGGGQIVALKESGTVFSAIADPKIIDKALAVRGFKNCFPTEPNFCTIMTPLTAFRGHDHKHHHGNPHDHDAPDPPWSWGVTPPETVIRW